MLLMHGTRASTIFTMVHVLTGVLRSRVHLFLHFLPPPLLLHVQTVKILVLIELRGRFRAARVFLLHFRQSINKQYVFERSCVIRLDITALFVKKRILELEPPRGNHGIKRG